MAAASGSGRALNEKREKTETKGGQGSPLASADPFAFQIYLKLAPLNSWSAEDLKALNLFPNTLLSLLAICREFEVSEAIKNLEAKVDEFIQSFHYFKNPDAFLGMSQSNLATVVSYEDFPLDEMDIFLHVCRWAELKGECNEIEKSGENMRGILGAVLFEIRFPRMSSSEFSKVCRFQNNLLSDSEIVAIYNFIGMDDQEKQKYDGSQLPFKTHARKQREPKTEFGCSTLCLTKNRPIVDSPPFLCYGDFNYNRFQTSGGRIALHGIGFLGPINEDSLFDVSVKVRRWINGSVAYDSGEKKKRIFGRKREIFHWVFDEPITIEQSDDKSTWYFTDLYEIWFSLKGHNTMAVERNYGDNEELEQSGIKFRFTWHSCRYQVAEFLYKKL